MKNIKSKKFLRWALGGLILILILAGFLRLWKLDRMSFIADEYIGINISYGYHKTGEWKFWNFTKNKISDYEYTRANVYYWQVAQLFKFLEPTEGNARLISVGWGIVGVALVFVVAYFMTGNLIISLLVSLFLSVSIVALMYDRKLRMYSMFAPVYLLLSVSLYQLIESRASTCSKVIKQFSEKAGLNFWYLPLVLLLTLLSVKVHLLSVNIFPMVGVYCLVMGLLMCSGKFKVNQFNKDSKNGFSNAYFQKNKYLFFVGLAALLSILMLIIALIKKTSLDLVLKEISLVAHWNYFDKVAIDYSHGILAVTVFGFGTYYLIKQCNKKGIWIVLSFLVPFILAMFTWDRVVGYQYIYFVTPFKVIIMASGVYFIASKLSGKFFKGNKWIFIGIIGYLFVVLLNWQFFFSRESFYESPKKWTYANYKHGFKYFLKHKKPDDLIIMKERMMGYNIRKNLRKENDKGLNILNYTSDNKLTLDQIKNAQRKYDRIWFITTNSEFSVENEAEDYIESSFKSIKTRYTNDGKMLIWLWER